MQTIPAFRRDGFVFKVSEQSLLCEAQEKNRTLVKPTGLTKVCISFDWSPPGIMSKANNPLFSSISLYSMNSPPCPYFFLTNTRPSLLPTSPQPLSQGRGA